MHESLAWDDVMTEGPVDPLWHGRKIFSNLKKNRIVALIFYTARFKEKMTNNYWNLAGNLLFPFHKISFQLEDNCFTMSCWFLP